jgi:hypothetical protein
MGMGMGHTQPTQNNNNRPGALVRAKIIFPCSSVMAMAKAMYGFMRGARLLHIKRTMQDPWLLPD